MESNEFRTKINELSSTRSTFVIMLNQHALNMTLNWLCNTKNMNSYFLINFFLL